MNNVGYEELCRSRRVFSAATLQDLHNSLYPMKAEFINCFIIPSKIIPSLKTSQNMLTFVDVKFTSIEHV